MSRREGRESETKRLQSKLEKERSPKRPRRDGKPATERTSSSSHNLEIVDRTDQDQKHRRRLQDALPLEAPLEPESKEPDAAKSELNKKTNGALDDTKLSSDPTEVPRSRSYFQHDERSSAGQGGRSFGRRATTERGWGGDPKDRFSDRARGDRTTVHNLQQRDEGTQARGDDSNVWHHDGFFELEADAPPPARKRPAFREKKLESESGNVAGITTESGRPSRLDRSVLGNARREERGGRYPHDLDRPERPFTGDRAPPHGRETQKGGFLARERFGGGSGSGSRGRDRFSGRHEDRNQNRPNSFRVEKWKHDLFDEANRSPTPKNEEDPIAKVEALLAL